MDLSEAQPRVDKSALGPFRGCVINSAIRELIEDYSIEILPKEAEARIGIGPCRLRAGTRVYIAYASGCPEEIVEAARIVHEKGLLPVPHIPARRFESFSELSGFIEALARRASVRQVLLIGGDNKEPAGQFEATIDVLRTGLLQSNGIRTFGVAGHPEGHPVVDQEAMRRALFEKQAYATKWGMDLYMVTQFLFDTQKLFAWHVDFVERTLPGVAIDVGLPGLAKATTLLRFAKECGVKTSLGMLTKNAARAFKLATNFSPEESLIDLASGAWRAGKAPFRSVHFFPFGSFERTTAWLETLLSGRSPLDEPARFTG